MAELPSMWENRLRKKDVCQGYLDSLPRRAPSAIPREDVRGTLEEQSPSRRVIGRRSAPPSRRSGGEEAQGSTKSNSGKRKQERENLPLPHAPEVPAIEVEVIEVLLGFQPKSHI